MQQLKDTISFQVKVRGGGNEGSPNSSPDDNRDKVKCVAHTSRSGSLQTAMSNITDSKEALSLIPPSRSFETYGAVNAHEPFTLVDITKVSTKNSTMKLIPFSFPKIQKKRMSTESIVVLVDLESLERFVEME